MPAVTQAHRSASSLMNASLRRARAHAIRAGEVLIALHQLGSQLATARRSAFALIVAVPRGTIIPPLFESRRCARR